MSSPVVVFLHTLPDDLLAVRAAALVNSLRRLSPHEVVVARVDTTQLHLTGAPHLNVDGRTVALEDIAGVVTRAFRKTGRTMVDTLDDLGLPVTNPPAATRISGSKIRTAARLLRHGVPVPHQSLLHADSPAIAATTALHGGTVILKRDEGARGEQVFLLDEPGVRAHLSAPEAPAWPWIVQDFIAEARGRDLRVVVARGNVIAGARRVNDVDEFRATGDGAVTTMCDVDDKVADIALRATAAVGLNVAGVDLLETNDGVVVTEVNSEPGLAWLTAQGGQAKIDELAAAQLADIGLA